MLKIYIDSTELSYSYENYNESEYSFTLLSSGEIMIGSSKPINALYVDFNNANANAATLSVYYYNGTSFLTTKINDGTKGFKKSGFIKWDRNLANETAKLEHGETLYWYKLKLSADSDLMNIKGIDLVFSSDDDLKEEYPSVLAMLPDGETSFIKFHVATRKDIVSRFRSEGRFVNKSNQRKLVDQWDFLEFEEVRDAAKFLTLSKILYWISDAIDDKWYQKAKYFENKYGEKMQSVSLSLDYNNDGKIDNNEVNAIQSITITRL